jgi:putative ATPase
MYLINQPLAHLLRPQSIDEFVGQTHLLGPGKSLRLSLEKAHLHSMILWGPPGTGKTSLAYLIAKLGHAHFEELSAISSGVKEIRELVEKAQRFKHQQFLVFIDEIHRYNKAQQDVLLPYIENGTLIVIGATTENPAFSLNNALLSRMRVYLLKTLDETALYQLLDRALIEISYRLKKTIEFPENLKKIFIHTMDGDARKLLNHLEILMNIAETDEAVVVTDILLAELLQGHPRQFDKNGTHFYEQISALHKSIRGSDPDASLYWFCRMIDGGCSPLYIGRRLVRIASEDIGLADPRALEITTNACLAYERLGSTEGELALAQAVVFLAVASKSDAVYQAYQNAMKFVQENGSAEVPMHLRNSSSYLAKQMSNAKAYQNPHNYPHAYVAGEQYFPDTMGRPTFYCPEDRGLESKIKAKLDFLRTLTKCD